MILMLSLIGVFWGYFGTEMTTECQHTKWPLRSGHFAFPWARSIHLCTP